MGSTYLLGGQFADDQELRFQTMKLSDMGCADLQGVLFDNWQDWRFQAAKL